MIEFLCPNGHRIRCQSEHAGRAAKCPRCGVKFRVPQTSDEDVWATSDPSDSRYRPEFIESTGSSRKLPSAAEIGRGSKLKEQQIEFLCPNGHRLHGPVSLLGHPGQCPECGSRFHIPTREEMDAAEREAQEAEQAARAEEPDREIDLGRLDVSARADVAKHDAGETQRSLPMPLESSEPAPEAPKSVPTGNEMAAIVARLWAMQSPTTTLKIRLRDGSTIAPDQFLQRQSQESNAGVFAVKEANGILSLIVVAWDAIGTVTLRGVGEIPSGMKDGGVG